MSTQCAWRALRRRASSTLIDLRKIRDEFTPCEQHEEQQEGRGRAGGSFDAEDDLK
jgi:hypothetical protein